MADMRDPLLPRDPLSRPELKDPEDRFYEERAAGTNWGWILGGLAAVLLVAFLLFGLGRNDRIAGTDTTPPVTTGQNTGAAPAAPRPAAQRPMPAPQENTGAR